MSKKKKKSSSSSKKYQDNKGKSFSTHAEAAASSAKNNASKSSSSSTKSSSSSSSSKAPTVNYTYDSTKETAAQYTARVAKEQKALNEYNAKTSTKEEDKKKEEKTTGTKTEAYDSSVLTKSAEFKALSKDDQEAVLAVFEVTANNDQQKAKQLAEAFKVASKQNDVYFAEQLRLASDAIERGYVEVDKEPEFKAEQAKKRLEDLKQDYATKKDFMSLEEASAMKEIEQGYKQNLDELQTGLVEGGFTSSSRRIQKEKILEEATGGLRESKQRAFAYDRSSLEDTLGRGERDTQAELDRLAEITKAGKLDFLRSAERRIGTANLPTLEGAGSPLGGVYGEIPAEKLQNTLSAMQGLVF